MRFFWTLGAADAIINTHQRNGPQAERWPAIGAVNWPSHRSGGTQSYAFRVFFPGMMSLNRVYAKYIQQRAIPPSHRIPNFLVDATLRPLHDYEWDAFSSSLFHPKSKVNTGHQQRYASHYASKQPPTPRRAPR